MYAWCKVALIGNVRHFSKPNVRPMSKSHMEASFIRCAETVPGVVAVLLNVTLDMPPQCSPPLIGVAEPNLSLVVQDYDTHCSLMNGLSAGTYDGPAVWFNSDRYFKMQGRRDGAPALRPDTKWGTHVSIYDGLIAAMNGSPAAEESAKPTKIFFVITNLRAYEKILVPDQLKLQLAYEFKLIAEHPMFSKFQIEFWMLPNATCLSAKHFCDADYDADAIAANIINPRLQCAARDVFTLELFKFEQAHVNVEVCLVPTVSHFAQHLWGMAAVNEQTSTWTFSVDKYAAIHQQIVSTSGAAVITCGPVSTPGAFKTIVKSAERDSIVFSVLSLYAKLDDAPDLQSLVATPDMTSPGKTCVIQINHDYALDLGSKSPVHTSLHCSDFSMSRSRPFVPSPDYAVAQDKFMRGDRLAKLAQGVHCIEKAKTKLAGQPVSTCRDDIARQAWQSCAMLFVDVSTDEASEEDVGRQRKTAKPLELAIDIAYTTLRSKFKKGLQEISNPDGNVVCSNNSSSNSAAAPHGFGISRASSVVTHFPNFLAQAHHQKPPIFGAGPAC